MKKKFCNLVVTSRFRILVLVSCFFYCSSLSASVLKKELPTLWNAIVEVLGASGASELTRGWTSDEVKYFRTKIEVHERKILEGVAAKNLYYFHGSDIVGLLGEIESNLWGKRLAAEVNGIFFDENQYARENPGGKKPDGLVYKVDGDTLHILAIMESKIGWPFSFEQFKGYLKAWSSDKITVNSRVYPAKKIFVALEGKAVSLAKFEGRHEELEALLRLTCTKEMCQFKKGKILKNASVQSPIDLHNFRASMREHPLSIDQIFKISRTFLSNHTKHMSNLHPSVKKKLADQLLKHKSKISRSRSKSEPFASESEFRLEVNEFVQRTLQTPKASDAGIGKRLASHMARNNISRPRLVTQYLDSETVLVLSVVGGSLPPLHSMRNHLLQLDSDSPHSVEILKAYLRVYEPKGPFKIMEDLQDPRISSSAPNWKGFFETVDLDKLISLSRLEQDKCKALILKQAYPPAN